MNTLKQEANEYEPKKTQNIADLDKVPVDVQIDERENIDKDGEVFRYKFITVDGEDYRVPISVIAELKMILKEKPNLEFFKVIKSGEGRNNTKYKVIPL